MASNPKDKVYLTEAQLSTLAGGGSITSGDDTYTADENTTYYTNDTSVSYEAQTLTAEQQAQARQNIGAGSANATSVLVDGTLQASISFDSDPQTQISAKVADVKIDTTSILDANKVADLKTINSNYNASTNKLATASDIPTQASDVGAEPTITTKNTAFNKNFETSTSNIKMDGTVSVGSLDTVARADHIHPSDTSKQNLIDSSHKLSADLVEDGTTNKVFTATEQSKLSGIESGAQVNTVTSVNTKTGAVVLNASDVGASNPNLLINGDFRINQRGQNSYTGNTYGVDRWLGVQSSTIVTKTSTGVSVSLTAQYSKLRQLVQNYEYLKGKQVTISAKISNYVRNKTYHTVFEVNDGVNENIRVILSNGIITATGTINANATKVEVSFYNYSNDANTDTFDVEWAKLEVGSIATQFIPKSYEEELSLCQMPYPASVSDNGTAYSGSFVNPNLLINGDLSVNQRGQTTYSGANKYTADRWQQGSGSFDYSTKTWTPSTQYSGFVQKIEDIDKFKGQTVTISAKINSVSNTSGFDLLINDGSNHRSSITFTGAGVRSYTYTVSATATQLRFGFIYLGTATTDTLSFEWVKVEFGSVATPFSPRPYAEEFAMCQRYYQVVKCAFTAYAQSSSIAYGWLTLQSSMRITPTATFPLLSNIYVHGNGSYLANPSSIAINGSIVGNTLEIAVEDSFNVNQLYAVHGGEVILYADL